MSKISNLIFKNADHYITSSYGKRTVISTSAGNTSAFHYGVDYGTNSKKLAQYAIENGTVLSCGKDTAANGYALFVWVSYPRIGKKFLHYHLDSISVKKGQTVKKGTLLGYTGKTGKATGIHLHLGMKDLATGNYEDPEAFAKTYTEPDTFLPARGYFTKGDKGTNVGKLAEFLSGKAKGNTYGDYLISLVKTFQTQNKLDPDGNVGPETLKALEAKGFKK